MYQLTRSQRRTFRALSGKKPSHRLTDMTVVTKRGDRPNQHYDAYIANGDHLERFVPPTQNLDNPPVEKPRYVKQTDGKVVRYVGP